MPETLLLLEELQYVLSTIPSDHNPYLEVAKYLGRVTKPFTFPPWAQWLQRLAILGLVIMFIQALYLIYMRIKTKTFQSYSFNEIGFLHVDGTSMCGIHICIFAPITIAELIYEDATGNMPFLVFGSKFVLLLNISLLFMWVCASQCAMLHSNCAISGGHMRDRRALRIVRFIMHLFLCGLLIWPIFIVWAFWMTSHEVDSMDKILWPIISQLLIAAPSFSRQSYNQVRLWQLCIPALQVGPHLELAASSVRIAIEAYLIIVVAASLLYIPLLFFSLRGLYVCAKAEEFLASKLMSSSVDGDLKFSSMYETTMRKRKLVVIYAISLYLITLTYIPVLIWMLSYEAQTYFRNPTWQLGTRLGLHVPVSIVGNLILFSLISNSRILYLEATKNILPRRL